MLVFGQLSFVNYPLVTRQAMEAARTKEVYIHDLGSEKYRLHACVYLDNIIEQCVIRFWILFLTVVLRVPK